MRGRFLYIYYSILIVLMMTWTSIDSAPPMPLRLIYMASVVLPGIFNNKAWLIAALTCFWSISVNGYAYSYMPTMNYLYALLAIVCLVLHRRKQTLFMQKDYLFLVLFFFYITFVNILTSSDIYDISYAFFVLCLFPLLTDEIDRESIDLFELTFMVITIVLSLYSLTTQTLFDSQYGSFDGVQRSGWTDPNYLAMIVGMGTLIGFSKIMKWNENNLITNIVSLAAFLIAIPAMLLVASRGAFVCLLGGMAILIMFSNTKAFYKFLVIAASFAFLIYLYNNSFFDLMEARIAADDGTGSDRTLIWSHKIQSFAEEGNIFNYIFGFGLYDGLRIGTGIMGGFHNDYLAFLVCYGVVGLIMFMTWLCMPFAGVNRNSSSRFMVYSCIIYLALASMTLEPITNGNFVYLAFWFYVSMLSRYSNNELKMNT